MNEAVGARIAPAELGPASQLIVLLEAGQVPAADRLTRELAEESVHWTPPRAETVVRLWWLAQWRRLTDQKEAAEIELVWNAAAARAREKEAEAAPEPKAEPALEPLASPAIITKPALSPLLPGLKSCPRHQSHRPAQPSWNV